MLLCRCHPLERSRSRYRYCFLHQSRRVLRTIHQKIRSETTKISLICQKKFREILLTLARSTDWPFVQTGHCPLSWHAFLEPSEVCVHCINSDMDRSHCNGLWFNDIWFKTSELRHVWTNCLGTDWIWLSSSKRMFKPRNRWIPRDKGS